MHLRCVYVWVIFNLCLHSWPSWVTLVLPYMLRTSATRATKLRNNKCGDYLHVENDDQVIAFTWRRLLADIPNETRDDWLNDAGGVLWFHERMCYDGGDGGDDLAITVQNIRESMQHFWMQWKIDALMLHHLSLLFNCVFVVHVCRLLGLWVIFCCQGVGIYWKRLWRSLHVLTSKWWWHYGNTTIFKVLHELGKAFKAL